MGLFKPQGMVRGMRDPVFVYRKGEQLKPNEDDTPLTVRV